MTDLILKQFVLGTLENNNYLLIDETSKEAVLIDCTESSAEIEKEIEAHAVKLKYILLTHGHFDHVMGVNYFREKYGCKALIHKDDQEVMDSIGTFTKNFLNYEAPIQHIDGYVSEGDVIQLGGYEIKVIHTPGHTQGGVCYLVDNNILFTGDTIFYECVGRTDLPGGSFSQLKDNIENKIFTLNENITIYPGHGQSTTVGHERVNNEFL